MNISNFPEPIVLHIVKQLPNFNEIRNLSIAMPKISEMINGRIHHFVLHGNSNFLSTTSKYNDQNRSNTFEIWFKDSIALRGNSPENNRSDYYLDESVGVFGKHSNIRNKGATSEYRAMNPAAMSYFENNDEYPSITDNVKEWESDDIRHQTLAFKMREYAIDRKFKNIYLPNFFNNSKIRKYFKEISEISKNKLFVNFIFHCPEQSIFMDIGIIFRYLYLEKVGNLEVFNTPFSIISSKAPWSTGWIFSEGCDYSNAETSLFSNVIDLDGRYEAEDISNDKVFYDLYYDRSIHSSKLGSNSGYIFPTRFDDELDKFIKRIIRRYGNRSSIRRYQSVRDIKEFMAYDLVLPSDPKELTTESLQSNNSETENKEITCPSCNGFHKHKNIFFSADEVTDFEEEIKLRILVQKELVARRQGARVFARFERQPSDYKVSAGVFDENFYLHADAKSIKKEYFHLKLLYTELMHTLFPETDDMIDLWFSIFKADKYRTRDKTLFSNFEENTGQGLRDYRTVLLENNILYIRLMNDSASKLSKTGHL